jgi:hypothetical protein
MFLKKNPQIFFSDFLKVACAKCPFFTLKIIIIHSVGGAEDWDGQLTVEEVKCPAGEPQGSSNAPTLGGWESGDYVGGWE